MVWPCESNNCYSVDDHEKQDMNGLGSARGWYIYSQDEAYH